MARSFEFPAGATPLGDCSGLIPKWVYSLGDLNRVEAENIAHAQRKYLKQRVPKPLEWFKIEKLKKIHQDMFGNVWDWAGRYRQSVTSIGIKPALIPSRLAEFCAEVTSWSHCPVELTFVEKAARIHHQLVLIHPFENGNGRFSRLIADRFLLAWRCHHPMWPGDLNQEGRARKKYIQALKSADGGNYQLLIKFMQELGADDPTIHELIQNKFYREFISGEQGTLFIKALLRIKDSWVEDASTLSLAQKMGLNEIASLLETTR
ncbi:MAG: hypothetical protein S4CHLAM2_15620 [Chlamydiales bacterium]|nr:hypothetical protein [Chlamydiales bacterium]